MQASIRDLWSICCGRSSIIDKDAIAQELHIWRGILLNGLDFYKPPSASAHSRVKSSSEVHRKDFVLKLSGFLNLDEWQTHELFQQFLISEFRGSGPQLQDILQHEGQVDVLMLKVLEYYLKERVYLLRITKYLLSYWQDETCLFREQFAQVVDYLAANNFIEKVIAKLKSMSNFAVSYSGIAGHTTAQKISAVHLLQEQCDLAEILLWYYKDFQMSPAKFIELATFLKSSRFGASQVNRQYLDSSSNVLIEKFGFISSLVLLEGLDLETVSSLRNPSSGIVHHFADDALRKDIDQLLCNWSDLPQHGPVLMGWTVYRHVAVKGEPGEITLNFGAAALQCGVMAYLLALLQSPTLSQPGDPVAGLTRSLVSILLDLALEIFQEETLGDFKMLVRLANGVLSEPTVAERFWMDKELTGLKLLLDATRKQFPFRICPLLDLLSTSCCNDVAAEMVLDGLDKQSSYCKLVGRNSNDDIEVTENENVWRCLKDRIVRRIGNRVIAIPCGSLGRLISSGGGSNDLRLLSWSFKYSGLAYLWLQFDIIIDSPLTYASDSGEDVFDIANSIIKLITRVLEQSIEKLAVMEQVLDRFYALLRRFSQLSSPPISALQSCLKCLTLLTKYWPQEIWGELLQTGFLPSIGRNIYDQGHVQDFKIMPGYIGNILSSTEIPSGSFKLSVEYLEYQLENLMTLFSGGASTKYDVMQLMNTYHKDLVANVAFIIKEIFAKYGRWRFADLDERCLIGEKCLQIFHSVLSPSFVDIPQEACKVSGLPSLKSVVREGLLYHEAGESLVSVLSVGVDAAETWLATKQSVKSDIIQLLKLALSVTNQLITDAGTAESTPLETALCQQLVSQPSEVDWTQALVSVPVLTVIGKYIYHQHDPKLSILAVILLRTLAMKFPMTLSASFGASAVPLRNAFVHRLSRRVEPLRLKIVILELLTSCVEKQPGLVELFLQLEPNRSDKSASRVGVLAVGKHSCLTPVLKFLEQTVANSTVDVLTSTSLDLLAVLWYHRHDAALTVIKSSENYWKNIIWTLKNVATLKVSKALLESVASVLKILAYETYYVKREQFDEKLKALLIDLPQVYERIGQLLDPSTQALEIATSCVGVAKSWRIWLSVHAELMPELSGLDKVHVQSGVLLKLVDALKGWTCSKLSLDAKKAACLEMASAFLVNIRRWSRSQTSAGNLLGKVTSVIEELSSENVELFLHVREPLLAAALALLQSDVEGLDSSSLTALMKAVCNSLHLHQHAQDVDKVSCIELSILAEIVRKSDGCVLPFVDILKQLATMQMLLQICEFCVKHQTNLGFVDGSLHFFLACSEHDELCGFLSASGVPAFFAIVIQPLYADVKRRESLGSALVEKFWTLSLAIVAQLLKVLRYAFMENALDFVGSCQDSLVQSMDILKLLTGSCSLAPAEQLSVFLYELSSYGAGLAFSLPDAFNRIKIGIGHMYHFCVALLARMKILATIVESKAGESVERMLARGGTPSPTASYRSRSDSVRSLKEDPLEPMSAEVEAAQASLLIILSNCSGALRRLTPNLIEVTLDEGFDIDSFLPMVDLNFAYPSLDGTPALSFGALIAACNMALKMIYKMALSDSDRTTPERDTSVSLPADCEKRRSLLWFTIDCSVVVLMSQASCYLRHPGVDQRNKQFLRRELGSELSNFVYAAHRYKNRRGFPPSPICAEKVNASSSMLRRSPVKLATAFSEDDDHTLFKLVDVYSKQLLA